MSIEQIQTQIQNINNNTSLTSEEKKFRVKLYQTLIESNFQESKYNQQLTQFIKSATELVNLSD
jgi:hypothetical protein